MPYVINEFSTSWAYPLTLTLIFSNFRWCRSFKKAGYEIETTLSWPRQPEYKLQIEAPKSIVDDSSYYYCKLRDSFTYMSSSML